MFDRLVPVSSQQDAGSVERGVERLCAIFDPLLEHSGHGLASDHRTELAALARVFDLPTSGSPADVWIELRPLLIANLLKSD